MNFNDIWVIGPADTKSGPIFGLSFLLHCHSVSFRQNLQYILIVNLAAKYFHSSIYQDYQVLPLVFLVSRPTNAYSDWL